MQSMKNAFKSATNKTGGAIKRMAAPSDATLAKMKANMMATVQRVKVRMMSMGWEGTLKVYAAVLGLRLMVGVGVKRETGDVTIDPSLLASVADTGAGDGEEEEEAPAATEEEVVSVEDSPEANRKFVAAVDKAMGKTVKQIRDLALRMKALEMSAFVGAGVDFTVLGTGFEVELEVQASSVERILATEA